MDGDLPQARPRGYLSSWSDRKLLTMGLLASWLLFFLWPLSLFIEIMLGIRLIQRKSRLRYLPFLLSSTLLVIVFTVLSTAIGYFGGTARYYDQSTGNEQYTIGHFSPRYRCRYEWSGGDLVMPWMSLLVTPNVVTIKTCYALFGPVKHTYQGPLPNKGDVIAWTKSKTCQQIPMAEFKSGSFQVAGTSVHLQPGAVAAALHGRKRRDPGRPIELDATQSDIVYAELYKGKCLVIMAPGDCAFWRDYPPARWIISLVDPATSKLFAQDLY